MKLEWKVEEEHGGILVREYLLKIKGISRRSLTAVKYQGGSIIVNEREVTVRHTLQTGDKVEVYFPHAEKIEGIIPQSIPIQIIYEDDHILVINKEANMATIPSRNHPDKTLANGILHYYKEKGLDYTVHVVNRLDKDTSGLLIVAKYQYAHYVFSMQHKEGNIKRRYEAVVEGKIMDSKQTINRPIGRKENSIIEREVREDGQIAITHYAVLKHFSNRTWISVQLETGRTHQIRVHLASIGHPLLGDDLYGGTLESIKRQALHSRELSFYHPFLDKDLHFESALPSDMKALINQ